VKIFFVERISSLRGELKEKTLPYDLDEFDDDYADIATNPNKQQLLLNSAEKAVHFRRYKSKLGNKLKY